MLFAALLTTILSAATPAQSAAEAVQEPDPPVRVSLDHKSYQPGEGAKVSVRARDDGYLLVLHMDPDGRLRVLFPLDPGDDNFVRGDHDYDIRGRGDRDEAFSIDAPSGQGTVYAALSRDPFRFDQFVRGDHWDYRVLGDSALKRDPEAGLTNLTEAMSTGHHFDYDIATYDVVRTIAGQTAPVYTSSRYYSYGWYDPWNDPWYWSPYGLYRPFGVYGSTFGFNVFLGHGYYRHRFHPYFYDPYFYDPYFYDPFFYGSSFLRPRCFYGFYCYRNIYIFSRPTYITYYPGKDRYRFKPGSPGGGGGVGIPYRPRAGYLTGGRPTSPLFPVSQFAEREGGRRVVDVPRRAPDVPAPRGGGGTIGRRGPTQGEGRTLELKGPERVVPREVTPLLREPRRVERPIPSVTPRAIVPREDAGRRQDAGRREERRLEPRRPEPRPMPPRIERRDTPRRVEPRASYEFRRPERRVDYAPRRPEPQRFESGRMMPRSFERGGHWGGGVRESRALAPRGGAMPSSSGARRRP